MKVILPFLNVYHDNRVKKVFLCNYSFPLQKDFEADRDKASLTGFKTEKRLDCVVKVL